MHRTFKTSRTRRVGAIAIVSLAITALLGVASVAEAAPIKKVALIVEGGARGDRSEQVVRRTLEQSYELASVGPLHAKLTAGLATAADRDKVAARVRAAAGERGVDAVVVVSLPSKRGPRVARVTVIDAERAAAPREIMLDDKPNARVDGNLVGTVATEVLATMGSAKQADDVVEKEISDDAANAATTPSSAAAPPVDFGPEVEGTGDAPPNADKVAPTEAVPDRGSYAVIQPRLGLGMRRFEFVDGRTPGLRQYDLDAAPRVGIAGEVYPFAGTRAPIARWLGVSGEYASSVGVQSEGSGKLFNTSWTNFDVAVRARIPLGARATVAPKVGYGGLDFGFESAEPQQTSFVDATLPSASYRFVRTGIDGRYEFGKLAALGSFDYLFVQDAGPMSARFPRNDVGGIEAHVGLGLTLRREIELRSGVYYQRFFFSMRPEVGDKNVAGGAADNFGRWETSVAASY